MLRTLSFLLLLFVAGCHFYYTPLEYYTPHQPPAPVSPLLRLDGYYWAPQFNENGVERVGSVRNYDGQSLPGAIFFYGDGSFRYLNGVDTTMLSEHVAKHERDFPSGHWGFYKTAHDSIFLEWMEINRLDYDTAYRYAYKGVLQGNSIHMFSGKDGSDPAKAIREKWKFTKMYTQPDSSYNYLRHIHACNKR